MSPIIPKVDVSTAPNDVQKITDDCFKPANWFVKYTEFDPAEDKYMAISLNYRDDIKSKEANATVQWLKSNNKVTLVEWCLTGFKIGLNELPAVTLESDDIVAFSKNAIMIANNTGISRVLKGEFAEVSEDLGFLEKDYLDVLIKQPTDDVGDDNASDDASTDCFPAAERGLQTVIRKVFALLNNLKQNINDLNKRENKQQDSTSER
ncbi:hypothetical protein RFI_01705 [Reticulomyxa filosa]|uniref:Tubulin/FtsZ 2-layer sandwich domain-containing protein n=1 Tax=Reticulomyxa filosa TaxID=46433 RepID=X6PB51_RETFI|nr:hypothetical protein RFI_01705 [Reticulomyxa filosa]|eukprot:ETO35358.1 hypothetical protein RFI_01705 [Reticulomyxa filosa]